MPALNVTNPYLRDPKKRRAMIIDSVYESSVFEGARGLKNVRGIYKVPRKRRSTASPKKSRKAS